MARIQLDIPEDINSQLTILKGLTQEKRKDIMILNILKKYCKIEIDSLQTK
jgi:hypothetical protein